MASVRKRSWTASDGTAKQAWQVDYRDQNGKRCSKQFSRKKDADAFLTQAGYEVSKGIHTSEGGSITVEKAVELWIASAETKKLERKTIDGYESTARLHIVPFLGKEKIARLRKPTIEAFKDQLVDSGRSSARVKRALVFLSLMLAEMERRGLVAQNVASGVKMIRKDREKREVVIPEPDELKAMLEHADADFRPFILTAMLTGMRASELRGLLWPYVDFEANVIRVVQRADERNKFGPPKSRAGRRSIPMSPRLVRELKEWKLRCPKTLLSLVFPAPEGNIWSYANIMNRRFWPLQIAAGVTVDLIDPDDGLPIWDENGKTLVDAKYSLHALRHGCASLWIKQGVDLKRLKTWMGHSSIQTTIDLYGHLMTDADGDATIVANAERALLG